MYMYAQWLCFFERMFFLWLVLLLIFPLSFQFFSRLVQTFCIDCVFSFSEFINSIDALE